MADSWTGRKPNPKFPACAEVARKLLGEIYGLQPGDSYPPEADLLARAREAAMAGNHGDVRDPRIVLAVPGGWRDYGVEPATWAGLADACKAQTALNMLEEIGGF